MKETPGHPHYYASETGDIFSRRGPNGEMLFEGYSHAVIARIFCVSSPSIHFIRHGVTWQRSGCGLTEEFKQWQVRNNRSEAVRVEQLVRQAVA